MRSFRAYLTALIAPLALLAHGQCPSGNVTISSQADANAFAANYGTCDTLPGDLIIGPGDISDYFAFSGVRMIQGDLRMQAIYPIPLDMVGFTQLAHIGGDIFINSTLTETFTGLSALQRIDGDLHVQFASMQNFTGLSALSVIGGDLYVSNASNMTSMNGLVVLDTIHGSIFMEGIVSPGFSLIQLPPQLEHVGGDILVGTQYATGMAGGNSLTHVGGTLHVQGPSLQSVSGFNNLSTIGGDLRFHDAPLLNSITGFASLDTIGGYFDYLSIPSLVSLSGFPDLKVITGSMWITGSGLQSIAGFGQLTHVGSLVLGSNPVLNDISAFNHPISLGDLTLEYNPALSYCHVQAVCEHLILGPTAGPIVANNASGCLSVPEVISFCGISTGIELSEPLHEPLIFPNPVRDVLRISGDEPLVSVKIHDATHRLVSTATSRTIDVSTLPAGHYMMEVQTGAQLHRRSFIKE